MMKKSVRLAALAPLIFASLAAVASSGDTDRPALTKACAEKDSVACFDLGYLDEHENQIHKAKHDYKLACDLKNVHACTNLANLYYKDSDLKSAEPLYKTSCDAGNMSGCNGLAYVLYKRDQQADALKLFKKACRGGFHQSCQRLRDMDFSDLEKTR